MDKSVINLCAFTWNQRSQYLYKVHIVKCMLPSAQHILYLRAHGRNNISPTGRLRPDSIVLGILCLWRVAIFCLFCFCIAYMENLWNWNNISVFRSLIRPKAERRGKILFGSAYYCFLFCMHRKTVSSEIEKIFLKIVTYHKIVLSL